MNKKFLLSTILASSIFITNQSASAVVRIRYNPGTYTINFNGTNYSDIPAILQAINTSMENGTEFEEPSIQDVQAIVNDLVFGQNTPAKQNLINNFPLLAENLLDVPITVAEVNKAIELANRSIASGIVTQQEITNFITHALMSDPENVRRNIAESMSYLEEALEAQALNNAQIQNRAIIESNIASINPEVATLINQKNALLEKPKLSRTPEENNLIDELEDKLGSLIQNDPDFITIRNSKESQEFLKYFLKNLETGMSSKFSVDLNTYLAIPAQITSNSSLPAVQKSDTQTTSGIMSATLANSNILNDRIRNFTSSLAVANSGIAAGEAFETFGAWIQGNYGVGQQKAYKMESGYKFNQKGVTIGFDTGDESLIGAAFSYFVNDVTNKTASSAKDKINTYIGSIYGLGVINPEFFVSGQFNFGKSQIKKSRDTGDMANNKASAKTNGTTIGGRAEVGYIYGIDDATQIVPTIGFAINKVNVKGYTEKGVGLNRAVGKRTASRNSGVAGLTLRYISDMGSMKVVPEIHANIDYAFSGKNSPTNITLGKGIFNPSTPSEKISKMYYNVGTSVKLVGINNNVVDVTIGYDAGLAKKFVSHTGALKLKVSF